MRATKKNGATNDAGMETVLGMAYIQYKAAMRKAGRVPAFAKDALLEAWADRAPTCLVTGKADNLRIVAMAPGPLTLQNIGFVHKNVYLMFTMDGSDGDCVETRLPGCRPSTTAPPTRAPRGPAQWARQKPCRFTIEALISASAMPTDADATTPHGEVVDHSAAAMRIRSAATPADSAVLVMRAGNPAFLWNAAANKAVWELPAVCLPEYRDYAVGGILHDLLPAEEHAGVLIAYVRPALVSEEGDEFRAAELTYSLYGGLAPLIPPAFMATLPAAVARYGPARLLAHAPAANPWPRVEPMCMGASARGVLGVADRAPFEALCMARRWTDGDTGGDMCGADKERAEGRARERNGGVYEEGCETARAAMAMLVRARRLVYFEDRLRWADV